MKHFTYFIAILVLCGGSKHANSKIVAKNTDLRNHQDQLILSRDLQKHVEHDENIIALTHANLIDGTGNPIKENHTLLIINGQFEAVGKDHEITVPKNAEVIDCSGKTIIPGIVGMHNHLHIPQIPFTGEVAAKLYLASGVTTIQTCGSASTAKEIQLSKQIEKGLVIGPDIITSGPYFTGAGGNPNMIIPRDDDQIRDTIAYWTKRGVRWFKVYRNTSPKDLETIILEAHRHNAKVTGHLCSVTFEEAANMGIDGIEHGLNSTSDFRNDKTYGICNGSRDYIDTLDITSETVKSLVQLMVEKNVFMTSTLAIYEASIAGRAFADQRTLDAMSPFLMDQYKDRRDRFDSANPEDAIRENRLKRIMAFEHRFFKMDGTLTAGVDPGRHVLPGFGDQRNFELLIEASFTAEEAIKIMTKNGADVLSKTNIGSIEQGKRADFVILNGNLKENPSVIRNVDMVFKKGYRHNPKSILKEVRGKFGER